MGCRAASSKATIGDVLGALLSNRSNGRQRPVTPLGSKGRGIAEQSHRDTFDVDVQVILNLTWGQIRKECPALMQPRPPLAHLDGRMLRTGTDMIAVTRCLLPWV